MNDDIIFKEIDEELEQDKYRKLWHAYGKYVLALIVVFVIGFAGFEGYKSYKINQLKKAAGAYFDLVEQTFPEPADPQTLATKFAELAEDTLFPYNVLAQLQQAQLLANKNDIEAALNVYETTLAINQIDLHLKNTIFARKLLLKLENNLQMSPEEQAYLQTITEETTPYWAQTFKEIEASFAANTKDYAKAKTILKDLLQTKHLLPSTKARSEELLESIPEQ